MAETMQQALEAIVQHLSARGIDADKITPQADLSDDLGLDSLDTVELTLALEEQFGIEIPDTELEDIATVQDALELIEKKRAVTA